MCLAFRKSDRRSQCVYSKSDEVLELEMNVESDVPACGTVKIIFPRVESREALLEMYKPRMRTKYKASFSECLYSLWLGDAIVCHGPLVLTLYLAR